MDWKLGVAMSSSSCKSFNSPYITLQLKVAESEGTIKQHTMQMTIPQFQVRAGFFLVGKGGNFAPPRAL